MVSFSNEFDVKLFPPLYLTCIYGYPHEFNYKLWKKHAPKFYGNKNCVSKFSTSFIRFIVEFNIIHEDATLKMLKMFSLSMQEKVREWFCTVILREISLFSYFFMVFQESWMVDEQKVR
jgi:hypothetical protein